MQALIAQARAATDSDAAAMEWLALRLVAMAQATSCGYVRASRPPAVLRLDDGPSADQL